ncbi:DMT family transporter [Anaerovorax odorimutans]|uniref:DMT family transporter n=1 Tax=Anaerovorax odorimutans TaxID=109327 RepID=UPI0003FCD5D2|nr:DMT family transporter [Anaerovorax odorimutans]
MNQSINVTEKKDKIKIYIYSVIFSFIVGFSFIGVKTCISIATPIEVLVHRFNFAVIGALILLLFGLIKINITEKPKKKLFITAGFYIAFMILQTIGLLFATSIESGIIFAVIPIMAKIIAGIVLKETTTIKQNIFVCLSVAAVIAMFVCGATDIHVNFIGLIILFIASLCMAISNVFMRYVREEYTTSEIAVCIAIIGFIVFNVAAIVIELKNGTLGNYFQPLTNMKFILATVYLGIPSTLISSLLMGYMLANMEAVKATVFGNLSTAISIIAGVIILHETLMLYHILCTILIIIGVIGVSLPSKIKSEKNNI